MNMLHDMKVGSKLAIIIIVAVMAVCISAGVGQYSLYKESQDMHVMYEQRLIPVQLLTEMRTVARANERAVAEIMLTTDLNQKQEIKNYISSLASRNNASMATIEQLPLDAKSQELLAEVKSTQAVNRNTRNAVIELAMQNKNTEAYALYTGKMKDETTVYGEALRSFAAYYQDISKQMDADNKAAVAATMRFSIGFVIVLLVLLALIGRYVARTITVPLNYMVAACREIAAGDFRAKPRKMVRKDEIGQLADVIVTMRDELRTILKQVNESAEQVAASSEQLTASADQSAQGVNQVAESVQDVAALADNQMSSVRTTTTIVEQVSSGVEETAATANQVAEHSLKAAEQAGKGEIAVATAVTQMSNIAKTVNTSSEVVMRLGERSKEIGQIVDTIAGIAGQTNLLALNAAIEAARAGEHGRGFAVVAEEVRKLAEQSEVAAKQIADLIGSVQTETEQAVAAMNKGTDEVKTGTMVVNSAGTAFQEIKTLVHGVADQVQNISAATQQMASGSQQLVSTVRDFEGISKRVSEETQTISAATEEQSASMTEIASASQNLAQLAQRLNDAVNKFQIN